MSDIEKIDKENYIDIFHRGGGIEEFKPYGEDIFLFDTYVAGTSYIENMESLQEKIEIDTKVKFFREIYNEYDENAIKICLTTGEKIGYIPQVDNEIFARLMDSGKYLFGKVYHKEKKARWWQIGIKIYLEG